jgi:hypothetical protein
MVDEPRYRERYRSDDRERDDWSDSRFEGRGSRRPEPRLEQRLDQWMTAGQQLVDGVAGARPGSRPSARSAAAGAAPRLRPGDLGRWVEQKIDWLLDDDDGWREPWQGAPAPAATPAPRRLPLQAISRRATPLLPEQRMSRAAAAPSSAAASAAAPDPQDWPQDDSFTLNRWRRPSGSPDLQAAAPTDQPRPLGRAVPRSSRRRLD